MPAPSDYAITIEGGGWRTTVRLTEEEFDRLAARLGEAGEASEQTRSRFLGLNEAWTRKEGDKR